MVSLATFALTVSTDVELAAARVLEVVGNAGRLREGFHYGANAVEFLLFAYRGRTGAAAFAADVENDGALFQEHKRVLVCGIGRIVLSSVKETVGRDVHDAHHERGSAID